MMTYLDDRPKKKQVIQAVTFLSPNVGGHQQPFKGHVYPSQNEYDRYVYTIFPYIYRQKTNKHSCR